MSLKPDLSLRSLESGNNDATGLWVRIEFDVHDTFSAHQGVEDDDMNVLCLGTRVIGPQLALEVIRAWDRAVFSNAERHVRRLAKVRAIEERYQRSREVGLG